MATWAETDAGRPLPAPGWQLEVALFAVGVELLAVGVIVESVGLARAGCLLLALSALLALVSAAETVRPTVSGRRVQERE